MGRDLNRLLRWRHASPRRSAAASRLARAGRRPAARPHRGQELHRARRRHAADQGHQPRQLADARGLHVQVRGRQVAAPDLRRLRPPAGTRAGQGVLAAVPRHLHHPRRYRASSSRSASTRCAFRCTTRLFMDAEGEITGEGWFLLDRVLGWVREAGLFAIVDLHAAPGGQTGINHDDGPGYPLMFYVPRDRAAHGQAVAGHRPALCRQSGDPGLRPPERADRALSRRGDAQSAARAVLQGGDGGDPRGRSRPRGDPGRRPVELELRYVRPALRRQPRLHVSLVLGEHEARFDPAPSQLRQPLRRAAVPGRDRRAHRRMERPASASCTRRTASAGRSGPTRTSTRPRPWSRSRGPTAGTRSWPSPTASGSTSPMRP